MKINVFYVFLLLYSLILPSCSKSESEDVTWKDVNNSFSELEKERSMIFEEIKGKEVNDSNVNQNEINGNNK